VDTSKEKKVYNCSPQKVDGASTVSSTVWFQDPNNELPDSGLGNKVNLFIFLESSKFSLQLLEDQRNTQFES
jgi:hypothetical protein